MKQSIVINREYGSGGREIGKIIAQRLGMPFFDTKILENTAGKKDLCRDILYEFDEKMVGSLIYDISLMAAADPESIAFPYKMYSAISDTIIHEAQKQPAIFIGRCADIILKSKKIDFVNAFIYSTDMEAKKKRAIEVDDVKAKDVESYIKKKDKARRVYQEFFTNTKFGNYKNYDICLDSSKFGYEKCADIIISSLK